MVSRVQSLHTPKLIAASTALSAAWHVICFRIWLFNESQTSVLCSGNSLRLRVCNQLDASILTLLGENGTFGNQDPPTVVRTA